MQKAVTVQRTVQHSIEDLATELMRPKVYWPSPWAEDAPEWLKNQIVIDRLAQLMKEGRTGMATYSEVVFYMMPRTMEAPLDNDWTEIYCWAGKQVMGDRMPEDIAPKELSEYQRSELDRLRRWIWKTSVDALKKKEGAEDRESRRTLNEKGYRFEGLARLRG
jgi:hypothetical protein